MKGISERLLPAAARDRRWPRLQVRRVHRELPLVVADRRSKGLLAHQEKHVAKAGPKARAEVACDGAGDVTFTVARSSSCIAN